MGYEMNIPSTMVFGRDSYKKAGEMAKRLGIKKVLLISDRFLETMGVVSKIKGAVTESGLGVAVYLDVQPDPTMKNVQDALDVYNTNHCTGIVVVGGGSSIDTAKAASVMANNPGSIRDYMGLFKVKNAGVPLIAIPTTAGTGSEATRVVVIMDTENNVKMMCLDNAFMASAAIIDYGLTMSMPSKLTAAVGVDALTHAIEAYVSKKANPAADMYALSAIALITANILKAYRMPDDECAREAMMRASTQAGIAFSNASVCAVHGMSRPIGAHFHIPHGLSNAMLLPTVCTHSIKGNYKKYAQVAAAMGVNTDDVDEKKASEILCLHLAKLNKELGIPNLKEYGVDKARYESVMEDMAQAAIDSGSPSNNPVVFRKPELINMYIEAYDC